MKIVRLLKFFFFKYLISLDKTTAFYALRTMYFDGIVRRTNEAKDFTWDSFNLDQQPTSFEELSGLFFRSPLSRGILRQDIDEAALLYKYVSRIRNPVGVEIGRFYGGSSVLLATAIGAKGKLYSIDIEPKDDDKLLIPVLNKLGFNDRVNLIIGDANIVNIEDELDFVLIDGDHSYEGARLDHNRWGKKIKEGGLIIHHDMTNSREHSVQWNDLRILYTAILEEQDSCLHVVEEAGSMVVFKKISNVWVDLIPCEKLLHTNVKGSRSLNNSYLNRESDTK